jgi:hypothetical protein
MLNKIQGSLSLGILFVSMAGCTSLTETAKLAQGPVIMAIQPIQVVVDVDTTKTLTGVSQTTTILGFIRFGDHQFADYPGISFGFGGPTKEKRAAIYKAMDGRELDVLVNPKFMIQERHAFIFRRTTVQVAGFGGKFIFE